MAKKELIKELTDIKGIGEAKAKAIVDNGFDDIKKLKKAKKTDLTKISGITDNIADKIIKNYQEEKKKAKPEKPKKTEVKKPEKKKTAEKKAKPKKTEKKEEEEEKPEKKPKKKPKLSSEIKKELEKRKEIKKRTPKFRREEWFRYKRISKNWRRPDGITSKMRINKKYRPSRVRIGFRGPKKTRGLHSSGFEEVMVYNPKDLEKINPDTEAARIGSSVGTKKRMDIEKAAEKLDIRILNL